MTVAVVWETYFGKANAEPGLQVTRKIWDDMRQCTGYVNHEIIADADREGHVLVISHWTGRVAAEAANNRYASHPNAVLANKLAREPRIRWFGVPADINEAGSENAA